MQKIKFINYNQEEPKKEYSGLVMGITSDEYLKVMVDTSENGKESWKESVVKPKDVTGFFITTFGQELEFTCFTQKVSYSSVI